MMLFGILFICMQTTTVVLFSRRVDATPTMSIHNQQRRPLTSIELHHHHHHHSKKIGSYSWQRFVNETTGIASSKETSSFILKPSSRDNKDAIGSVFATAEQVFSSYLSWLVRPAISLGVLREKASLPRINSGGETAIQFRWLAINLLCFGPPSRSVKNVNHPKSITTSFPVTGGLFALGDNNRRQSRGGPAIRQYDDNDADNMGALCLTLFQEDNNEPLSSSSRSSSNQDESRRRFIIQTELIGYRPSLAGYPPVHSFRKWTYLSTQSMVHAYVMWRFHRHLFHQIFLKTELTTA